MGYRFIPHLSDIIIEAEGNTFEIAFAALAEGMFTQMGEAKPRQKKTVSATGKTPEVLVVNALSELLAEMEIERFTPAKVEGIKVDLKNGKMSFTVLGEAKQPKNIIKAVTFHELIVKEERGKWTLRVLFDI